MKNKGNLMGFAKAYYNVLRKGSPFAKASRIAQRDRTRRVLTYSPRKTVKTTTTPMGTRRILRRQGGAIASKSRGFLSKGSKKWRKRKQVKYNKKDSFSQTYEFGKVVAGVDAVWVGHATWSRQALLKLAGENILGKIVRAAGFGDGMVGEGASIYGVQPGDIIQIGYQLTTDGVTQITGYTVPGGGISFGLFASWFIDPARPWNSNQSNDQFVFLFGSLLRSGSNWGVINLKDMKLCVFVKSSFKIQNRSKAAGGSPDAQESTEVVDNVPLYGKSYSGKGSMLESKMFDFNPNDLVADTTYAIIEGSEAIPGRKEPPQANEFRNVTSQGKIHLDPAEIKTSVLTCTHHMYLNQLVWQCVVPTNSKSIATRYGKFRVFALEKMIDVGATENISVAIEHNLDVFMSSTIEPHPFTIRQFLHVNG